MGNEEEKEDAYHLGCPTARLNELCVCVCPGFRQTLNSMLMMMPKIKGFWLLSFLLWTLLLKLTFPEIKRDGETLEIRLVKKICFHKF